MFFSSYVLALNELLNKKHAQKTLMKLSPGPQSLAHCVELFAWDIITPYEFDLTNLFEEIERMKRKRERI